MSRDLINQARRAAEKDGLSPSWVLGQARTGSVFLVDDRYIALPEGRLKENETLHDYRFAIVAQGVRYGPTTRPRTILVVPCSSSHQGAVAPWDYEIPKDEKAFTAPRVVAYTSLVQPVLKMDLKQHLGFVSAATLTEIQTRLLDVQGLLRRETVKLPPRST